MTKTPQKNRLQEALRGFLSRFQEEGGSRVAPRGSQELTEPLRAKLSKAKKKTQAERKKRRREQKARIKRGYRMRSQVLSLSDVYSKMKYRWQKKGETVFMSKQEFLDMLPEEEYPKETSIAVYRKDIDKGYTVDNCKILVDGIDITNYSKYY